MPRKYRSTADTGKRILLVDDDPEYSSAMKTLLEGEGHAVTCSGSGPDGISELRENHYDLVLVDYYMPGMTGEEMIVKVREFDKAVQIVIQTGYANEQPPRDLVKRLDIQGYFNKSEGPEKLLLWVDVGLKAAYSLQLILKSREGLAYILNVTPDMHKIKSLDELLHGLLLQISGLLGIGDSFLAVLPSKRRDIQSKVPEGFVATVSDDSELIIQAGTGKFESRLGIHKYLAPSTIEIIRQALQSNRISVDGSSQIVPLTVGDNRIGVIYVDARIRDDSELELLNVFANQAAAAINNAKLFEMATFDPLSKVFLRGMFMSSFIRELRVSHRTGESLCLLMLDMNGMKKINDSLGHLAGDQALSILGDALTSSTRQTDIKGRIGGDEFAVLLVGSEEKGAEVVNAKIQAYLEGKTVEGQGLTMPVSCSVGSCVLRGAKPESWRQGSFEAVYFQYIGRTMMMAADKSLYESKRSKGAVKAGSVMNVGWTPYVEAKREFSEKDYDIM